MAGMLFCFHTLGHYAQTKSPAQTDDTDHNRLITGVIQHIAHKGLIDPVKHMQY